MPLSLSSLFKPPNIERLLAAGDIDRIIQALIYQWDPKIREAASTALIKLGAPAIEPLISALVNKDSRADLRMRVVWVLGEIGAPSVSPLVELLGREPEVRPFAADALARIGFPSLRSLVVLLQDSSRVAGPKLKQFESREDLQKTILETLRRIGGVPTAEALIGTFNVWLEYDIEKEIRSLIVGIGSAAVEPLLDALTAALKQLSGPLSAASKGQQSRVIEQAAMTLEGLGDTRAIPLLVDALTIADSGARVWAASAVTSLGWKPANASQSLMLAVAARRWEELAGFGASAVEPLVALLQDRDEHVRIEAAKTLGTIGDERSVEPLIRALRSRASYTSIRDAEHEALIKTLGDIGDPRAVEPLIAELRGSCGYNAASALGQMPQHSIQALLHTLHDPDKDVRALATKALGYTRDARAVEGLCTALDDQDYWVRRQAAEALGAIGDSRALQSLFSALDDKSSSVRAAAASALGHTPDSRSVDTLLRVLRDPDKEVRAEAATALGHLRDPRALPELTRLALDDDAMVAVGYSVAARAQVAIESIAGADATEALRAKARAEMEAQMGPRRKEISAMPMETLTGELRRIDQALARWTSSDGDKRLQRLLEETRLIGEELWRRGGEKAMRAAYQSAGVGRSVDMAWNGIGSWQG